MGNESCELRPGDVLHPTLSGCVTAALMGETARTTLTAVLARLPMQRAFQRLSRQTLKKTSRGFH